MPVADHQPPSTSSKQAERAASWPIDFSSPQTSDMKSGGGTAKTANRPWGKRQNVPCCESGGGAGGDFTPVATTPVDGCWLGCPAAEELPAPVAPCAPDTGDVAFAADEPFWAVAWAPGAVATDEVLLLVCGPEGGLVVEFSVTLPAAGAVALDEVPVTPLTAGAVALDEVPAIPAADAF